VSDKIDLVIVCQLLDLVIVCHGILTTKMGKPSLSHEQFGVVSWAVLELEKLTNFILGL
jgi:hypothetical protein